MHLNVNDPKNSYEMRILWITTFLLCASISAKELPNDSTTVQDSWIGFDKIQHATFSFLWVLGIQYIAVNKSGLDENEAFQISFSSSASLGFLKEICDRKKPGGHFCKKDLIANGLGLVLATAIVLKNPKR